MKMKKPSEKPGGTRMNVDQAVEISLPNRMGYERIAMACAASYAKVLGFNPDRIEDLKTAISEACINAIEHGNREREDAKVLVRLSAENKTLTVWVVDEGSGLSSIPPEPSIEKKIDNKEPPRGFGLFLMRNLANELSFDRLGDDGHAVKMVFEAVH
jgi:serine/threonine-protein kinase RsbW